MSVIDAFHAKAEAVSDLLGNVSIFRMTTFVLLVLITIFRKRLSSNDEYRRKPTTEKQAYCKTKPIVIRSADVNKEKICFSRMSADVTIQIVSYLNNSDISSLMATSKKMYTELSIDCIWEQLWMQTYGAMWQHPEIRKIREGRGIFWDPMLNYGPPQQGWYRFFLLFEVTWMDWILAGYCTHTSCLIGIDNAVVDVTNFIDVHPGSSETLTEASGCDASDTFAEIGHSSQADALLRSLTIWDSSTSNESTCRCSDAHMQRSEARCGHCLQLARRRKNTKCTPIFNHQQRSFPPRSKLHEHMKVNKKKVTELAMRKHYEAAANALAANHPNELHFDSFAAVIPLLDAVQTSTSSMVSAVQTGTNNMVSAVQTSTNDMVNNSILNGRLEESDSDDDYSADTASEYSIETESSDPAEGPDGDDGLPEVAGNMSVIFSPSKSLSSVLDKISRTYRRAGSMQRSLQFANLRAPQATTVGGGGTGGDGSGIGGGVSDATREEEKEELEDPAPLDSYFGPCTDTVPALGSHGDCLQPQDHLGQAKAYFDPFTEEWTVWWSCCGQGQVLIEAAMPAVEKHASDVIFCK